MSGQVLRPLDRLPNDQQNVLAEFLDERVRPWGTAPVRLSVVESGALWTLFACNVALGAWLLAVQAGAAASSGLLSTVVTLGGHPTLTLILAGVCVAALIVAVPLTRGLTRSGGPPLILVAVGGLCGVTAVAGAAAVLVAVALCLVVTLGVLFVVVDRL